MTGWPSDPDARLREIVADLDRLGELKVFTAEFDNYGSGFASFVEVKLTRRDNSLVATDGDRVETQGFGLLLNRLAPIAALQYEAAQSRSDTTGSETLPSRHGLTGVPVPAFPESEAVVHVLRKHGYEIANPEPLRDPIAASHQP